MASNRYAQEKGNRFENRCIRRLWDAVHRHWPWKKFEKPDEGFHPPPELAGWRFEFRARKHPQIMSAMAKAQKEADDPRLAVVISSPSGSDAAFDGHRVYATVPWDLFRELVGDSLTGQTYAMPHKRMEDERT